MALDGILLYKIVPGIRQILPCRIQKIYEISDTEILFQVHGAGGRHQMMVSCHSVYNRLLLSSRSYPTPQEPGNFVMVLRKYLEGATFTGIRQGGLDRWCVLDVSRHNNLGDLETDRLYIELMGKYANVILVGPDGRIIDALKRIPPFENARRTVQPGAQFHETEAQDKRNPFTDFRVEEDKPLTQQFLGFSPFLSREFEYRMAHGQSFREIMELIKASQRLYIANDKEEAVFHCIPLESVGVCRDYPLFEGFDILYFHKEEKERIKKISGDLYHFVRRELKHQTQKLPRLTEEYDEAMDCDKWKHWGELLYAYQIQDTKGEKEILLKDFDTGADVKIPLDPRLDGRHNAARCFSRYSKGKKGQVWLSEQIRLCENEISYLQSLLEQLDQADFETAAEIREELIRQGLLKAKPLKRRKKDAEEKPHVSSIRLASGIQILYGRNNLQNETLTWHLARKDDIWLHAKDYHGAHVVIRDPDPDEETLRAGALIAAYYSAGRSSSSLPVNYCPVRNLKKIPGAKPGMVQLSSYKTIYMDPDEDLLERIGAAD